MKNESNFEAKLKKRVAYEKKAGCSSNICLKIIVLNAW